MRIELKPLGVKLVYCKAVKQDYDFDAAVLHRLVLSWSDNQTLSLPILALLTV
jgi:hypothetical protein